MDRRASEIVGLPVITYGKGNKIYNVEDLLIEPERKQVLALLVLEWSMFKSARAIPFGRIQAVGPDAVVVPDSRAIIDVNRDPVLKKLYDKQIVRGLKVLTEEGRKLGEISDMLLDSKTGEIRGFYVSIGKVLSVTQGLRWLPAENVTSIGQRVIYVPAQIAQEFETQSGGWTDALDQAGDKIRAVGAKANERLVELGDQVRETVPRQTSTLVVGKKAHRTVTAEDGSTVVQEGEVITEDQVETARKENRVPQLLMSAGVGPLQQHGGVLGNQATQNLADMRNEARDLWSQLLGNYSRSIDQADDKLMQKRIKRALGRPTTRVILDNDDNVILNTGDIITNKAVQAARDASVLDVLVDSVYTERPNLTLNDLKASGSGTASLENLGNSTSGNSNRGVATQTEMLNDQEMGNDVGMQPRSRVRRPRDGTTSPMPSEQA